MANRMVTCSMTSRDPTARTGPLATWRGCALRALSIVSLFFYTRRPVSKRYERSSSYCCCYQIFHSLRLCRFSTDRNETFTYINDIILHQRGGGGGDGMQKQQKLLTTVSGSRQLRVVVLVYATAFR